MSRKSLALLLVLGMLAGIVAAAPAAEAKKKKKKPPAACAAFAPGEVGAGAPTVVLTDAATEAAPVPQPITLDMSLANLGLGALPLDPSSAVFNVQVDTAAPDAGLYMSMAFEPNRDYDLWFLHAADGSVGASSHEWNTAYLPGAGYPPVLSGNGSHGNESTAESEAILGIKVPDCGGFTVVVQNWMGEGGDFELPLYLGAATIDPLPVGEEFMP